MVVATAATNNPKKKRTRSEPGAAAAAAASAASMTTLSLEQHFGTTLLTKVGAPPEPTAKVLQGKELIGVYFSSSWYVLNAALLSPFITYLQNQTPTRPPRKVCK
jgi:hypothetical protein